MMLRARRYAAIQERLIGPEGTFPPIGRSLCYRFGAFHLLAEMALRQQLPEGISPEQVRSGLTAVMRRMVDAPGTFDDHGWLTVGFYGHQPSIAESYISTVAVTSARQLGSRWGSGTGSILDWPRCALDCEKDLDG